MDAMPLSPNDLTNLIAIRSLRDLAVGQAKASGAVQRQAAVILLDAAIERTAFTAAEYLLGSFSDRETVEKPLQYLRERGWNVGTGLETSRKRLHKVRNAVQHVGTGVDRDELPQWVIDSERVIASIVLFAYEIQLDQVFYSGAVRDEQIRNHLDAAESAISGGEFDQAMSAINKVYSTVTGIWNQFAIASNYELGPRSPRYIDGFGAVGGDDSKVVAIQNVALLTAIAPEPGEALWFLEAHRRPDLLNSEEVRRALVFVFNLATAVEASPAARQEDRRRRENIAKRRERTSAVPHAKIRSYQIGQQFDQTIVTFYLEGVPSPAEYDEWRRGVDGLLHGTSSTQTLRVSDAGEIVLREPDSDFVDLVSIIESALASAESAVAAHRAETARELAIAQAEEDDFRARVIAAIPPVLPSWLRLGTTNTEYGERPYAVTVDVSFPGDHHQHNEIRKAISDAVGDAYTAAEGWVCVSVVPEEIPGFVADLVPRLEAILANQLEADAAVREQYRPVMEELARRGYSLERD